MALVSCIVPTHNRRKWLPESIRCFLRQHHAERELIIVDDGSDEVRDLVPRDERIRYIRLATRQTIGAKRNLACREARGQIILHWDDDDWMADWRVSYQARRLEESGAEICGLDRLDYYEPETGKAWEYRYSAHGRPWVAGNTLCYRRRFWESHPFQEIDVAEDARFVWQARPEQVLRLEDKRFLVAMVHAANASPKVTAGSCWRPLDAAALRERMGTKARPPALLAAARGIGDILRTTPLVRALDRLGYGVDLLLQPDFAETEDLIRGAPEVREVFTEPPAGRRYEIAAFTAWAAPLAAQVTAARKLVFDRGEWLRNGDSYCVSKIARALGWQGEMPAPFAVASERRFDLPLNTVALHAGCKADWPWKKWHGFDELAALLPDVALVGMPDDLANQGTYFAREFRWPGHVRDFVGKLSLADTAALLQQCAALVANDSGIMHLGAALGVRTLGVFGITSPEREGVAAPNFFPVTKGLPCEPACRRQAWGRRDCEHHLRCLKELTAAEVKARLDEVIGGGEMQKLRVAYYGHVFDASGYGNAARAYIHALHAAGVELSVYDLSAHGRQVSDPLVEGLVGREMQADFHLFHGIPHVWAARAFRLRNAVAITVWETDTMPTQWRNALNHALETWLPCDFNVEAFRGQVSRVAKIPHAVMPRNGHEPLPDAREFLRVEPDEFVVYSIFEWQDRKAPGEQLRAFLRAFTGRDRAVLILKINPGAGEAAARALAEARNESGSDARVELRAEAWSDSGIEALHQRGDCYLSLHRGEGWCYPLFDAACRGVPVVATAYSGPMEYLDAEHHQLVRYDMGPVKQHYMYYHPRMRWANPDVVEAAQRLRWVYEYRGEARAKAGKAAEEIRRRYALEDVGRLARGRLLELLKRTNPARISELAAAPHDGMRAAPVPEPAPEGPIAGEWYDADYFEHGRKSNWGRGYSWTVFHGLFRDIAAYLTAMFPLAQSFLDAGCAKGFLVKALRQAGKEASGFDASPWAIGHAELEARPFVRLAGVDDYEFQSDVDVLLCFDLLPHLTEAQAGAFLRRSRAHVRMALVAVIDTYERAGERRPGDRDLSHITRQTREWWDERIREAGWKQNGLTRNLEHICRHHDLPRKMGWHVYVYTPE